VTLKNETKSIPYVFTLKLFCQNAGIAAQLVGVGVVIHHEL